MNQWLKCCWLLEQILFVFGVFFPKKTAGIIFLLDTNMVGSLTYQTPCALKSVRVTDSGTVKHLFMSYKQLIDKQMGLACINQTESNGCCFAFVFCCCFQLNRTYFFIWVRTAGLWTENCYIVRLLACAILHKGKCHHCIVTNSLHLLLE